MPITSATRLSANACSVEMQNKNAAKNSSVDRIKGPQSPNFHSYQAAPGPASCRAPAMKVSKGKYQLPVQCRVSRITDAGPIGFIMAFGIPCRCVVRPFESGRACAQAVGIRLSYSTFGPLKGFSFLGLVEMSRYLVWILMCFGCAGAVSAAPEQKAGIGPVCLYDSKSYSEGAYVC